MLGSFQAPAKINLTLEITGRDNLGYHILQSLVGFSSLYDEILLEPSDAMRFSYEILGNFPIDHEAFSRNNLVMRFLERLHAPPMHVHLRKRIPVGAGLGGGSSDVAALFHALTSDLSMLSGLGADIPLCLQHHQSPRNLLWMRGTGYEGNALPILLSPEFLKKTFLLINPGVFVSTPDVFNRYRATRIKFDPVRSAPKSFEDCEHLIEVSRNTLFDACAFFCPEIISILESLTPLASGLSGSGPTLWAIYDDQEKTLSDVRSIQEIHPNVWYAMTNLDVSSDSFSH